MEVAEKNTDDFINSPLHTEYAEAKTGLKIDLGCGTNCRPRYTGLDYVSLEELTALNPETAPESYIQQDLLSFPWNIEDDSVSATFSAHFVEHIPHYLPGISQHATDDGWWYFFKELYRVMEDGGICEFVHPFSRSDRAFWDPTHTRYIHAQTWFYLNREHRKQLGTDHYAPDINFEVLEIQTLHEPTLLENRSSDVIEFARQFYFNTTDDLFVVLKVEK